MLLILLAIIGTEIGAGASYWIVFSLLCAGKVIKVIFGD